MLLPKRLLLLATRREKGTIYLRASSRINYGLAGAVLMELASRDKVDIRKKKLIVVDSKPTGTAYLDYALERITQAKSNKKAKYWVQKLGNNKLRKQVYRDLVNEDMVKDDSRHFLGIFPIHRYPIENVDAVDKLVRDVQEAVFTEEIDQVEENRTVLLLGLLNTCQLTSILFSPEDKKEAKKRIKAIMESNVLANSVSEAVQAVDSAVVTAVAATSAANSSSS
ncbi:GOLPH3/VPS74 family protein [Alkalibacillus haloalkaliphilus]|uniref:GPP34 family phosphoprotein n=1 Tax=Alkalibacillus haloalkaliphilus TaxID=94136 RepID=A0A511W0N2_9BACI|nr:GPP34 family phosphoprotein [Alkalibacillus haloalkaliphilus]GEN44625.1 GPP34 family phosphoprotein [Alkalibacillus haloalkaliphilus]